MLCIGKGRVREAPKARYHVTLHYPGNHAHYLRQIKVNQSRYTNDNAMHN